MKLRPSLLQTALTACLLCLAAPGTTHADENLVHNIVDDGWSTPLGHRFSGRITEQHHVAAEGSGKRSTTYRTTRLLLTSGEGGRLKWTVGPLAWETRSDAQGYWELRGTQSLETAGLHPGWHDIQSDPGASSRAGVLVHDTRNTRGLISDIDDTILVSQVNSKRRLVFNSLTKPPEARQAVQGMAAAYQELIRLNPNPQATPVFYVSASPRQLTDGIRRFLDHNGFPRGVLQLKEVNSSLADPLTDQKAYKLRRIEAIFQAFPTVTFALMGDDGEHDPEVFDALRAKFPHQVSEVWIRRVHPDPDRPKLPGQRDMAEFLTQTRP